ncbi:hypothetical protein V8F20_004557 [Naviculisporaceae sp. PSN 640]
MSADLFAAFETPPAESNSQKTQKPGTTPSLTSASQPDPFSFLTASPPSTAPQPQPFQWQPITTQTTAPTGLWPTVASPASQPPVQNSNVWGDLSGLGGFQSPQVQTKQESVKEEDDDWGDFEAPAGAAQIPAVSNTIQEPVRNRVVRASTIDMLSNKLIDLSTTPSNPDPWVAGSSREEPKTKPARAGPPRTRDPNVLFDASDFELHDDIEGDEDDDDFGDFEAQPSQVLPTLSSVSSSGAGTSSFGATQPKKQPPSLLLSGQTTSSNGSLYPQAPKSPYGSFQTRKPDPMKELKVKTPQTVDFPQEVQRRSPSPVTAWPDGGNDDFDNDWAEFEDLPSDPKPANKSTAAKKKGPGKPSVVNPQPVLNNSLTDTGTVGPPPTNIPPPSVLLSIFPQLLDVASTSLFKPISGLSASKQQLVTANEATRVFLEGYLALATVAARIIAGRKLRWHRDKFLMQGMTISAAGGKGGMKLAGIDKTQSAREDREAAEVMNVWKAQVGRLRSAVAAANAASSSAGTTTAPLKVPELSLHVSAHAAANVVTAPKPCVMCGLKREERIAKVDYDVEDSFGEWWVEFWGHRACRNFWLQHEVKLRQR